MALPPAISTAVISTTGFQGTQPDLGVLDYLRSATIVIPWGGMAVAVVLTSALAAGVAALLAGPDPALSRRPT